MVKLSDNYLPISVLSWDNYQNDKLSDLQPFIELTVKGSHRTISRTENGIYPDYPRDCQGYTQLTLWDVYDFGSYRSGFIKAKIRNGYRVKICFRIMSRSNSSYIAQNFKTGLLNQYMGKWNNECFTTLTSGSVKINHTRDWSTANYGCREFILVGGDEFQFDIEANFSRNDVHQYKNFSLIVNGETVAKDNSEAVDDSLVVSIHSVERKPNPADIESLTDLVLANEQVAVMQNKEMDFRSRIVDSAKSFLGDPFYWGGNTPKKAIDPITNQRGLGTDCSGFVLFVLNEQIPTLKMKDMKASAIAKEFPIVNIPSPGDLVFFTNSSGNIVHVDILEELTESSLKVIGCHGGSKTTKGNVPSACVKQRTISNVDSNFFFCSVRSAINGIPLSYSGTSYSKINLRDKDTVKSIQLYLRSMGLYNGKIDGVYSHKEKEKLSSTQKGVMALQDLYEKRTGYTDYESGIFDEKLLKAINIYDIDLSVEDMTNIHDLYNNHLSNKGFSIESFNDPFYKFKIKNANLDEKEGGTLTLSKANGGSEMCLTVSQGWVVRFRLEGPSDFFTHNLKDPKYHVRIGNCGNLLSGKSFAELELTGGDVLYINYSNNPSFRPTPPPYIGNARLPDGSFAIPKYLVGNFHVTLDGLVNSKSNIGTIDEQIVVKIFSIESPHSEEWKDFNSSNSHDWKSGSLEMEKPFGSQITKLFDIPGILNELKNEGDKVNCIARLQCSFKYSINSAIGFEITRLNNDRYCLMTTWLLGGGVEFGVRTYGYPNQRNQNGKVNDRKFAAGGYVGAGATFTGALTFNNAYEFDSKSDLAEVFPYSILSILSPMTLSDWIVGDDTITTLARDSHNNWKINVDLEGNAFFNAGVNFDSPKMKTKLLETSLNANLRIKLGGFKEHDYHSNKIRLGSNFEIESSMNSFSSLGIMESLDTYSAEIRKGGTTDFSKQFYLFNLKNVIKGTVILYETDGPWQNLKRVGEPLDSITINQNTSDNQNSQSFDLLANEFSNINLQSNTNKGLRYITIPIFVGDTRIEVTIRFKSSTFALFRLLGNLALPNADPIFDILGNLASTYEFSELQVQILKYTEKKTSYGGSLKLPIGVEVGLMMSLECTKDECTTLLSFDQGNIGQLSQTESERNLQLREVRTILSSNIIGLTKE